MSMTNPVGTMAEPWDNLETPSLAAAPTASASIVPKSSIAGTSLAAVIAIMTFLASLTAGATMMVVSAANEWRSDLGREVTIQVRPAPGRDLEADVRKAAEVTRGTAGVADVRPFTKEESAKLVEPWLGDGLALDELPIPRLIVVKLAGGKPDLAVLRKTLTGQVPGASLDDHRRWADRMRNMAGTAVAGGVAVLVLVLAATVLSVTFATRGAMAANRPIIEVMHYVGATDGFVGSQFQRHFLLLGFKGGAIGGGGAILLFAIAEAANAWLVGTPGGDEIAALFGNLSIGVSGYLAIFVQIVLMAVVAAFASRRTVDRTLETVN